ncbi:MAG: NUDIX domain-containing protein [Candidatus Saccharibacteria bacterium]
MKPPRYKVIPAVYILFRKGDELLLIRRFQTGYNDGKYGLPSGHVDGGEPSEAAAAREALEEVGVVVKLEDLKFVHLMHRQVDPADREGVERMDIFFEATKWDGELTNCEPHKCDELRWSTVAELPENSIVEVAHVLRQIEAGSYYSSFNF